MGLLPFYYKYVKILGHGVYWEPSQEEERTDKEFASCESLVAISKLLEKQIGRLTTTNPTII